MQNVTGGTVMQSIFFKVKWRFFAKSTQDYSLTIIGKLTPDLTEILPDEVLVKILVEIAAGKLEKVEKYGGKVCEEIPRLNEFSGKNPRIAFQIKFKTLEDLMKYRKEMF